MQVLRDLTGGSRGSYVECELCERRYLLPLGWAGTCPRCNGALASYSVHGWSLWFKAAKESATDTLPEGGPYALTMDGETGVMSPIDESVEKM